MATAIWLPMLVRRRVSSLVKCLGRRLKMLIAPIMELLDLRGTLAKERNPLVFAIVLSKLGSWDRSGTIIGSPDWATAPVKPSPI